MKGIWIYWPPNESEVREDLDKARQAERPSREVAIKADDLFVGRVESCRICSASRWIDLSHAALLSKAAR